MGDAAEGIVLAAERLNSSEPVNTGSAYEISIRDLLETVRTVTGFQGEIVWDTSTVRRKYHGGNSASLPLVETVGSFPPGFTSKPNGRPRRKLDTQRAQELFGFRAETPFDAGLQTTVDWYRETVGLQRMRTAAN